MKSPFFMGWATLLFVASFLVSCSHSPKYTPRSVSFPILQGHTTATTTQLNLLVPVWAKPKVYILNSKTKKSVGQARLRKRKMRQSEWMVYRVFVEGLQLNEQYEILVKSKISNSQSRGYFKTLDLNKPQARVAIASCLDSQFKDQIKPMWSRLRSTQPDMIFLIGDQVYAYENMKLRDTPTPDVYWQRFLESRLNPDSHFLNEQLIPTYAVWDDGDFGMNNGNKTHPHLHKFTNIFKTFHAQRADNATLVRGPGVAFSLRAFNTRFVFADNRSFREKMSDSGDKHYWGARQEAWVNLQMAIDGRFSWLINGEQFFGHYHKWDSFGGHYPKTLKKTLKRISQSPSKVFLVSGDRHLIELMKIRPPDLPYDTLELTTSSLHAKVYPSSWNEAPNPRQIHGVAGQHNFATVDLHSTPGKMSLFIQGWGAQENPLFTHKKTYDLN